MTTTDQHIIFLLAAMLAADAAKSAPGASGLSPEKQLAMDDVLQKRFPGLSDRERWDQVAAAIQGRTGFGGGIGFLKAIEKSGRKVASGLKRDTAKCYRLIKQLKTIAESDGKVTVQEMHVLRSASNSLGLGKTLRISHTDTAITLAQA